ncbi:MAG: hypothetical protein ACOZQL_12585 [Myxococcota bacterium]
MVRTALAIAVLTASAAFATGERITITGAAAPLQDTLCFSMTCGQGPKDFTVSGRAVKGGVELTVTSASGQRRLTHVAPLNADGQIGSTDLVRATSLVVKAIENGPIAATPPAAKKTLASRRLLKSAVAKR